MSAALEASSRARWRAATAAVAPVFHSDNALPLRMPSMRPVSPEKIVSHMSTSPGRKCVE
jgi:hypothetical protein